MNDDTNGEYLMRNDDVDKARDLLEQCGESNPEPFDLAHIACQMAMLRITHANALMNWHESNSPASVPDYALDAATNRISAGVRPRKSKRATRSFSIAS